MKRTVTTRLALSSLLALGLTLSAAVAMAAPPANSSVFITRVFNDDSDSDLSTSDAYPASLSITDAVLNGDGFGSEFANLHVWRLSTDDINPVDFANGDGFTLGATLVISGTGNGEAGLNVSPWWSQNVDGRLNVRTGDGEIAVFGGRLPFYSFTGSHGLSYVKGTPIGVKILFRPNGLSMANPATMEYIVDYNANTYSSGQLNLDEGNPAEDPPHGLWGILNEARVGGYVQPLIQVGNIDNNLTATWTNILYLPESPTAAVSGTWGRIKKAYR
jgi:hypothetical protein